MHRVRHDSCALDFTTQKGIWACPLLVSNLLWGWACPLLVSNLLWGWADSPRATTHNTHPSAVCVCVLAVSRWAESNETFVDAVTTAWSKICQQTCGPPPRCRKQAQVMLAAGEGAALAGTSTLCGRTNCDCTPKICVREEEADEKKLCQDITCDLKSAEFTVEDRALAQGLPLNAEYFTLQHVGDKPWALDFPVVHSSLVGLHIKCVSSRYGATRAAA